MLSNELVKARILHAAPPVSVHVGTVIDPGGSAVQPDMKANRLAGLGWRKHEMKVAGVKAIRDLSGLFVQRGKLAADGPNTR